MTIPIFGTGLARSGGALYSSILSAHPEIEFACCPNIDYFKFLRSACVKQWTRSRVRIPETEPLSDWYFELEGQISLRKYLDELSLDLELGDASLVDVRRAAVERGALESPDVAPLFGQLQGADFKELMDSQLALIRQARGGTNTQMVGFHETWVIDAFPALARAYPDARFIIMLRDPRAIIASMLGVAGQFPDQVVEISSYARHWRKYVALARLFSQMDLFRGRLVISSHDSIVTDPEREVPRISEALGIVFDPKMVDHESFVDPHTQKPWKGNSSFDDSISSFSSDRSHRWRFKMDYATVAAVEFLLGPDLPLAGLVPATPFADPRLPPPTWLVERLKADLEAPSNWRSSRKDPLELIKLELRRRDAVLDSTLDAQETAQLFLTAGTHQVLRQTWASR